MKKTITLAALLLCGLNLLAQEMKKFSVSVTNPGGNTVAASCDGKQALIIYYSLIPDLKFISENPIHEQAYDSELHRYRLCVEPNKVYNIRIVHPDFALTKHRVEKMIAKTTAEFILNPVVPVVDEAATGKRRINVTTTPNNAIVYLDGVSKGRTPIDLDVEEGFHALKLKREGYFTRTVYTRVRHGYITYVEKRLFRKTIISFDALYGFDTWGGEFGLTANNFSAAFDFLYRTKNDYYSDGKAMATVNDHYTSPAETYMRVAAADSQGHGWAVKAGFSFGRPMTARVHIGYGHRDIFYNQTYAQGQAMVRGTEVRREQLQYYLVGAQVSVFRLFNVLADYWYNEQRSSVVVGFGMNIQGR